MDKGKKGTIVPDCHDAAHSERASKRIMQSKNTSIDASTRLHWEEDGERLSARWRSESGNQPPKRVVVGDDQMTADHAFRLASEGIAILWRGDLQNAHQLLQAMARRIEKRPRKKKEAPASPVDVSASARAIATRAHAGHTGVPTRGDYTILLRRAPDVRQVCEKVYGPGNEPSIVSLREVLGLVGAHEWSKKDVEIRTAGGKIHPYYGVYSPPVRGEYIELVANQPLPSKSLAFDIGTGTGVLAAVLARRRTYWGDRSRSACAGVRTRRMRMWIGWD